MALLKDIKLKNGIVTNYHRIGNVTIEVNNKIKIQVFSYLSKEEREKEINYNDIVKRARNYEETTKEELDLIQNRLEIFIDKRNYELDYNPSINVQNAYEYLKELEDFKNAESDE